jgi:16S rRNA C967 or C1407 C5-methylase (RsmB/RsmF family)
MVQKFRDRHLFTFLNRFDQEEKPLDGAFSDYLRAHKSIGAHDRRFLGDTIYSLIRWKGLLDYLSDPSPILQTVISPNSVHVKSDRLQYSWERRYELFQKLNLQNLPRHLPLWVSSGASPWLFDELSRAYGEARAAELCLILNEPAPLTVRANLLKTSREHLLASWSSQFEVEACKNAPAGIRFLKRTPLTALDAFKQGLFEIQDEGSQLLAELVRAKPGEQVLDYCSGSGGKSLAIAPLLRGKGQIYLHDIRSTILQQAKKRFCRAGVQNAQFLNSEHPHLSYLKGKMDWVLADVPCSGSGTYRRNPDMKWKGNTAMLERLVKTQREIMQKACLYVKEGAHLVYGTCSMFPCENECQVTYFLDALPLTLESPPFSIQPSSQGPDGFFAAVFRKKKDL